MRSRTVMKIKKSSTCYLLSSKATTDLFEVNDNGIDIIIGSHPHTLQPIFWGKKSGQLTAYSLGNFLSGQRERY